MNGKQTFFMAIGGIVVAVMALVVALVAMGNHSGTPAQAQVLNPSGIQNGVSVNGQGSVTVTPDVVRFTVGVNLRGATVTAAQQQAAKQMEAIKKALTDQGIKAEDIQTANFDIHPDYIYDQGKSPVLNGYVVNTNFNVVVRDISKAGAILDAVGTAGANQISNIQFGREKESDLIKQARVAAMADAKAKADQLAGAGGFALGSVLQVSENSSSPVNAVRVSAGANMVAASDSAAVIESGQLRVIVNVTVTYAIK